ncbi:endonuclease/exonuclease/phosphatase family protein [Nocardioides donggukensis]|uniref:Endonuclease/exonuclease/phosphatase family protein n=1 Tax=Nocardioides donggukensis TaxID=2774019 RepID=A0A927K386_9ACTN|nr:endonuclease/exonuclease/phosphatase family protein [Nocardioides donggukensis]MBD8868941.1 endonuclease/exonuclease/phosphatase family protein [Nocardioides donggukensis]
MAAPVWSRGRPRAGRGLVLVLLVPAVLLTGAWLVEPLVGQSGTLVRAVAFTPYALPGYALAGAGLLVAWARHRRPATGVALLVAVTGCLLHAWWLAPVYAGAEPAPAAGSPSLAVLSVNLLGGAADEAAVLRQAVDRDVDVLVLQEITAASLARLESAGLEARYPHRAGRAGADVEGTMILSRHPLSRVERVRTGFGSWAATVAVRGTPVRLLGVHPRPPIGSARDWRDDHAVIAEAVTRGVDLVAGDFNATADHRPMRALAGRGWRSAAELANVGWAPTWPADGQVRVLGLALPRLVGIDHVLVGERLAVLEASRVPVPGTDHSGVLAEVTARATSESAVGWRAP